MKKTKNQRMKHCLSAIMLFISVSVFAQETVVEKFQKITTIPQAQAYIDANPQLKPALLKLSAGKDTSLIDKRLLRQKQGDIFSVGYVTYKVLEAKESIQYRASYIFLDGGSLTPSEVETLKKEIMGKINAGENFAALSDKYTMDGNKTKGDTDWFYGEYSFPKEFQDAVSKHAKGEVFFLDVADKDWHYIIKKTYDDDVKKDITVLRANGR